MITRLGSGRLPDGWRERAACLGVDSDIFFPAQKGGRPEVRSPQAVEICSTCQVREPCAEFAQTRRVAFGIWAGQGAAFHRKEANRRGLPYLGLT